MRGFLSYGKIVGEGAGRRHRTWQAGRRHLLGCLFSPAGELVAAGAVAKPNKGVTCRPFAGYRQNNEKRRQHNSQEQ